MGIYVNPGNLGFASAVNSQIYIDKTGLLEYTNRVLGTEQCRMCVSRPRRFGKSMAADMLTAYYSRGADSAQLFCSLRIAQAASYEEHRNRYDQTAKQAQDAYIGLLRGLFKSGYSKQFLLLAYITGILPMKRYNSESARNNFDEFTMTSPGRLAEYVGFTEEEVKQLCEAYGMDFEEARHWYDGYSFPRLKHVYSPNSVVKAMLSGEYGSYWTSTVAYESLKDYISLNYDGLKDAIVQMISGGTCQVNVSTFENDMTCLKSRDDVLTMLVHLGYLAYHAKKREACIPNEEVRIAFSDAVRNTEWTSVVEACKASDALLRATWNGDAPTVAEGIEAVHMANTSILNYNDENALSCVITLAYFNAINEYILEREQPSGKGYADIVFRPRKYSDKPAMIVELKYGRSAEEAIAQIKERRYAETLQDFQGRILLVGINYDKNEKKHTCRIEEWNDG